MSEPSAPRCTGAAPWPARAALRGRCALAGARRPAMGAGAATSAPPSPEALCATNLASSFGCGRAAPAKGREAQRAAAPSPARAALRARAALQWARALRRARLPRPRRSAQQTSRAHSGAGARHRRKGVRHGAPQRPRRHVPPCRREPPCDGSGRCDERASLARGALHRNTATNLASSSGCGRAAPAEGREARRAAATREAALDSSATRRSPRSAQPERGRGAAAEKARVAFGVWRSAGRRRGDLAGARQGGRRQPPALQGTHAGEAAQRAAAAGGRDRGGGPRRATVGLRELE